MGESAITCVIDRIDQAELKAIESVFTASENKIVVDMRRVRGTTPAGVARLARLVRLAQRRSVIVEVVGASPAARRALVDAGLHHLVALSE